MSKERFDIHQHLTDRIVSAIEAGEKYRLWRKWRLHVDEDHGRLVVALLGPLDRPGVSDALECQLAQRCHDIGACWNVLLGFGGLSDSNHNIRAES